MAKHAHKKEHVKGKGAELVGKPDGIINKIISGKEERNFALDEIVNEGPAHKQVLSALLLNELNKLVQVIEKNSGSSFKLQRGTTVVIEKHEEETELPVALPVNGNKATKDAIAETVSHAPMHEAILFALSLQAIEWSIKTLSNKN